MAGMLTPDLAREAYQSAIPERRERFGRAEQRCRDDAAHKNFMQQYYMAELMRLGKDELRMRFEMAMTRVKQLIDSGWEPSAIASVRSAYLGMFAQHNHWNRDTHSDLTHAIESAPLFGGGNPTVQERNLYILEFSQYQVDISTEFIHELEFYVAAKQPKDSNITNLTLQGNVNFLQTGGTSKVTQNIGFNAIEVATLLEKLKSAVSESDEPFASALEDMADRALVETKKPDSTWVSVGKTLDGFQNLVRTTGAVPAAWKLVAGVAGAHGVHLPGLPGM